MPTRCCLPSSRWLPPRGSTTAIDSPRSFSSPETGVAMLPMRLTISCKLDSHWLLDIHRRWSKHLCTSHLPKRSPSQYYPALGARLADYAWILEDGSESRCKHVYMFKCLMSIFKQELNTELWHFRWNVSRHWARTAWLMISHDNNSLHNYDFGMSGLGRVAIYLSVGFHMWVNGVDV